MTKPLILIHALRLHEGEARHPGGNYHHMHYLLGALLPLAYDDGLDVKVLVDELGARDLAPVVPREQMELAGTSSDGVLASDRVVREAVKRLEPAVYYRPTGQLPFGRLPCRTMMGVADLNFRWLKTSWSKWLYKEFSYRWSFHAANKIVTVSEFTRSDILTKFDVPAEKLCVIPHGASELSAAEPFSVAKPRYWLTFGHQAHKNVELCLRAMQSIESEQSLVVVGQSEHISKILMPLAEKLGVAQRVEFVGRVTSAQLHWLYQHAIGLVFVSKFEGFGLPILEAMQIGCPVICSDVCSLPEVAGDAAVLVPPDRLDYLVEAMKSIGEGGGRDDLIRKGQIRARRFTWTESARKTVAVIQSLLRDIS